MRGRVPLVTYSRKLLDSLAIRPDTRAAMLTIKKMTKALGGGCCLKIRR